MKSFKILAALLFLSLNSWAVSSTSIYNLNGKWTDQDKQQVEFSSLNGRVRIVSMVFTSCASACPMIVGDIKQILSKLPPTVADKVSVDMFSFDHQKDTPEALKAFMKKMRIEKPQWTMYHGDKATISKLAAILGVQYKLLENGAYVHSNNIILVNKEGEVLKTIEGYDASVDDFISLLKKAVADSSGS